MKGISALYILDKKGKILVTRHYRNDVPHYINDKFNQKIIEFDEFTMRPIFMHNGYCFIFYNYTNITFLAVSTKNCNVMMILTFLQSIKDILIDYFKTLEAESIKDNFIMIYELFDEIMDNGYPQTTEIKVLKKAIKTEAHELIREKTFKKEKNLGKEMTDAVNSIHPWRPGKYKYSKNEAYLDVVEKVNMLVSSSGQVIKSEVEGALKMKCYLSGTPDLILGLNDKKFFDMSGRTTKRRTVDIDDIKFHQCVKMGKFENERTITFVPPDGEFDLITYRMESAYKPLFTVQVKEVKKTETKLEFVVKAKSHYRDRIVATWVEFYIPVPPDSNNIVTKGTQGAIKYEPDKNALKWRVKQLAGKKEIKMKCSLHMPVIKSSDYDKYKKRPVSIEFEIPYYTLSGINVRYLKINEKSGYHALSWVRYLARNGDFNVRTHNQL